MATVPSVKIIKSFEFKNGIRLWSNRYHFLGGTPADATHWHTLMDAITASEKTTLTNRNTIVQAVGYDAGSDVPVASKTYSLVGTLTAAGGSVAAPGEVVGLIRYSTNARTTKNHPIYCFNYMHGVDVQSASYNVVDSLDATTKTAFLAYTASWIAGFSDGTITATRSSPRGAAATGAIVEEFVTHRDFPPSTSV